MDETTTHLFSSAKANKWTQFVIQCIQVAAADVLNGKEKEANRRAYRFTTQIHVSLRLGKKHWHTSNIPCTYIQACKYSPSVSVSHSSTWSKALISISSWPKWCIQLPVQIYKVRTNLCDRINTGLRFPARKWQFYH
jgi:hypothetical protein